MPLYNAASCFSLKDKRSTCKDGVSPQTASCLRNRDAITGSSRNQTYDRKTIIQFLRSKEWVIKDLEDVEDKQQVKSQSQWSALS